MLILKPNCELCDRDLAADSTEAMICSYECTFCQNCVAAVLENVCPNCGGGFSSRPIRPKTDRRPGVSLRHTPSSLDRVQTRYSEADIKKFVSAIKKIPPEKR